MEVIDTPLAGLKIVKLKVHGDARGFFVERYSHDRFADAGLPTDFVQDNHSRSAAGVLRGLHWQHQPAQGKLVGVTRGAVWDVAVDIRPNSPTYGQYLGVELSDQNGQLFWIPPGFAHGFCVLGDEPADMLYKVSGGLYNAAGEGGIRFDDPQIAIDWPLENPQISPRDTALMSFKDYQENPLSW